MLHWFFPFNLLPSSAIHSVFCFVYSQTDFTDFLIIPAFLFRFIFNLLNSKYLLKILNFLRTFFEPFNTHKIAHFLLVSPLFFLSPLLECRRSVVSVVSLSFRVHIMWKIGLKRDTISMQKCRMCLILTFNIELYKQNSLAFCLLASWILFCFYTKIHTIVMCVCGWVGVCFLWVISGTL